jgi:putative endonuclease
MYVYLIESLSNPKKHYVGITKNLKTRLKKHNAGTTLYTAKFKPWKLKTAIWFADIGKAEKFERYLKTGSGYAFAKRHLW